MSGIKHTILLTIEDLCTNFLYYDRKEDENLPRGVIEDAIENGDITIDEMVNEFRKHLEKNFL